MAKHCNECGKKISYKDMKYYKEVELCKNCALEYYRYLKNCPTLNSYDSVILPKEEL